MSLRERSRPRLGIIEPCLPSPAKVPPSGPDWIHEIKHDGFRIMARRDGTGVRLVSRNGHDFTSRFPLAAAAALLAAWMFRFETVGPYGIEHRNRFTGATCHHTEECWFRGD